MLLNISVFLWYGAVCPWAAFRTTEVIPLYRLVFLGILILLFRRLPMVFAFHSKIREIEEFQQAAFVGYFGPIGVSGIFYLYISVEFLATVTVNGHVREDAARLEEVMRVVVWFLAICSIVVHGLSIPLGKMGYNLPRTMSQALSSDSREGSGLPQTRSQQDGITDQGTELRRRRPIGNPERRPSTGAFQIGRPEGLNGRGVGGGSGTDSPREPSRPIHFIESVPPTGVQTPVEQEASRGPEAVGK